MHLFIHLSVEGQTELLKGVRQPHLAQCYFPRVALMLYSVHKSKIYFEVQLGVN